MELHELVLQGDRRALSRMITRIENGDPTIQSSLDTLYRCTGRAHLIGITGATGSGKSSLVNQLVHYIRKNAPQIRVAVIAIDPSSPFSGGALLGDRIRMRDLLDDPGVYIRSMAARGAMGGIAAATSTVCQVFDACGYDIIFIETVGAGQSEVEIAGLAHTTIVVDAPGMGDDIQAIKAGILEIADIVVLNKADRPGAEAAESALRSMLLFSDLETGWRPRVLLTVATNNQGTGEVVQAIEEHMKYLHQTGMWEEKAKRRAEYEFETTLRAIFWNNLQKLFQDMDIEYFRQQVTGHELSPNQAACKLIEQIGLTRK